MRRANQFNRLENSLKKEPDSIESGSFAVGVAGFESRPVANLRFAYRDEDPRFCNQIEDLVKTGTYDPLLPKHASRQWF